LAQQMQGKNPPQPPDHSVLIALSIAALAKQLGGLAPLEKDGAKRDAMRAKSAESIERARDVARLWPDRLYITVPPDWEPPNMFEPARTVRTCDLSRRRHD